MRNRECGHDRDERAEAPEGDYQAKEKEQMIAAVQNVHETQLYEPQGRLMPARVELNHTRVTSKFEGSNSATRRQESQHGNSSHSQPSQFGVNGKTGPFGLDRII